MRTTWRRFYSVTFTEPIPPISHAKRTAQPFVSGSQFHAGPVTLRPPRCFDGRQVAGGVETKKALALRSASGVANE
jgi:hypothetical protein